MLFIMIAALFSVSVSVALKIYKQHGLNIFQILAFNYISASILALIWLKPNFSQFDLSTPWWLILLLGILLPSIFWCLDRSLQYAGMVKTEVAQRISVVLTILISALIYQESFSFLKILGIILGVFSVAFILFSHKKSLKENNILSTVSILSVWIGYAIIDLLFKYTSSLGLQFSNTLTAIFICSTIIMFIVNIYRNSKWNIKSVLAGLLLGVLNFTNIAFYLQAHRILSENPAIVFASMNILVVLFGVICAIVIFKEEITRYKIMGGIFAIIAVYCFMQAMLH